MGRTVKNNGGFAIVEILVSLMLVSLVLIAITAVFPRMTSDRKVVRDMDQARAIAAEVLEMVQFEAQANPAFNPATLSANRRVGNTTFNITVTPAADDPADPNFIPTVTINVSWPRGGRVQNIELAGVW